MLVKTTTPAMNKARIYFLPFRFVEPDFKRRHGARHGIGRAATAFWLRIILQCLAGWRRLSLKIADIGSDGFDLRLGKLMGYRLHDRGGVGLRRILAPLLVPARQFPEDVVMELTRQTGKRVGSLGIRSVTGSARRNVSAGNAFIVDFLPRGCEFSWSPSQRLGIEIL